ncbi:MAG: glycosyltransferase family 1 protein [Candidatus Shapirobacteria bacterium]|jgi:glycosyltransferase involved in cell wall biosynthesis
MMHIVIDARLYGPKHTGLGRYTKNLLIALKDQSDFKKYHFTLLVYSELLPEVKNDLGNNFTYVTTKFRHYSIQEQLLLPFLLRSLKPDLVHFTHLDKPIFYGGKSVVTVHDLIRHFSKGPATSTRNSLFYWPKYWGYLLMTRFIFNTSFIIVPSNFWRDYIIEKYHFNSQKIITTYEAVDPEFLQKSSRLSNPEPRISDYLIYTGNLYPHKNIEVVFEALKKLPKLKLKIICARSVFTQRIVKLVRLNHLEKQVEFLGYLPDNKFQQIYQRALALVHPSFLEGFSLTGLEAMALNCPVIAANSSCLPEIYENSVLYFNPHNPDDLIKQIKLLQKSPTLRNKLLKLGHQQVTKYSWSKTAIQTLNFYQELLNS